METGRLHGVIFLPTCPAGTEHVFVLREAGNKSEGAQKPVDIHCRSPKRMPTKTLYLTSKICSHKVMHKRVLLQTLFSDTSE